MRSHLVRGICGLRSVEPVTHYRVAHVRCLGSDLMSLFVSLASASRRYWQPLGPWQSHIPAPCRRGAPASIDLHRQQTRGLPWPEMGKNLAEGVLFASLFIEIKFRGSGLHVAEAVSCTRHCHLAWAAFRILDTLLHAHKLFLTAKSAMQPFPRRPAGAGRCEKVRPDHALGLGTPDQSRAAGAASPCLRNQKPGTFEAFGRKLGFSGPSQKMQPGC